MPTAQLLADFARRTLPLLFLLAGAQSQALTLGRIQGAALIGRPLLVSIAVQLEAGQNLGSSCFDADVFHGDNKQDPAGVRIRLEPSASGQGNILRVSSDTPVDEPIVTVYLRVACNQAATRRYVMLADVVSEQAAPAIPQLGAVPLVTPGAAPEGATPSVPGTQAAAAASGSAPARASPALARAGQGVATRRAPGARQGSTAAVPTRRPTPPAVGRPAPARPMASRAAVAAAKPAPAGPTSREPSAVPIQEAAPGRPAGQSRLRLEPPGALPDGMGTASPVSPPTLSETAAREARELQRLDNLEASVQSLVTLAASNEASLMELRTRLERAQAQRYHNPVIYLLLALLLLCLVAIAYLYSRSSGRTRHHGAAQWWDSSAERQSSEMHAAIPMKLPAAESFALPGAKSEADSGLSAISEPSPLFQPSAFSRSDPVSVQPTQRMSQALPSRHAGALAAQLDVNLMEMSQSTFDRLMQSGTTHTAIGSRRSSALFAGAGAPGALLASGSSTPQALRIDSDGLVDVRQQAEFFISLGQTDQAVQVLEARIAQDNTSCPQVYLDLLQLFRSLGLKADFSRLRDDFTQIFNVQVPPFVEFDAGEGRNLEDYPGTVDRLIAAWERASVLEVIEQLLYRQDGVGSQPPFELAGFGDLLTLHAVAQAVRGGNWKSSGARSAGPLRSLNADPLDIDLTELFATPAAPMGGQSDTGPFDAAAPSGSPAPNLIDFDLSEVSSDGKHGPG